jgi:hypothetical protein
MRRIVEIMRGIVELNTPIICYGMEYRIMQNWNGVNNKTPASMEIELYNN